MRERRPHLILAGLIVLALVGVAFLSQRKHVTKGIDLAGGVEVVYQAVPHGGKITSDELQKSKSIMEQRINGTGAKEPDVRTQGSNQIVIELPGIKDTAKALDQIGKTAQLEMYDFETAATGPTKGQNGDVLPNPDAYKLLTGAGAKPITKAEDVPSDAENPSQEYVVVSSGKKHKVYAIVGNSQLAKKQLAKEGRVVLVPPKGTKLITCVPSRDSACGGSAAAKEYYLFKFGRGGFPQIKGKNLKLSGIRSDVDTNGGGYLVTLAFDGKGDKAFQRITKAEFDRGAQLYAFQPAGTDPACCFQHNAIVLDNELYSTPYIDFKNGQLSDGISGGGQIGNLQSFARRLRARDRAPDGRAAGRLPRARAAPDLGDARQGLAPPGEASRRSAACSSVALFLLLFYRFLGLVAVLGLGIYAALLYGAILLLDVTLTLPGFAGMILTIGVAADANVVIFERIKEEVRAGKSVRAAIAAGYAKGFHTIVDANVVTAITALVLFAVATAGVKGFALMLLIGTVLSLVTAVAATRAMLGLLAGFKWFDEPALHGRAAASRERSGSRSTSCGAATLWFAISGVDHAHQLRLARRPRAEPRHRLQGRHADRVQDAEAAHGLGRSPP